MSRSIILVLVLLIRKYTSAKYSKPGPKNLRLAKGPTKCITKRSLNCGIWLLYLFLQNKTNRVFSSDKIFGTCLLGAKTYSLSIKIPYKRFQRARFTFIDIAIDYLP